MTIDEIARQVLELNEKATKGRRVVVCCACGGDWMIRRMIRHYCDEGHFDPSSRRPTVIYETNDIIFRTSATLLAKAMLRMKEALEYTHDYGTLFQVREGARAALRDVEEMLKDEK